MTVGDIEAPYGFQIVDADVDASGNSAALYSYVSSSTFEKTTVLVTGDISVAQSFGGQEVSYADLVSDPLLSTPKLVTAEQSGAEGLYLRAVNIGETSTFEIVADFGAAVGDLDFTVSVVGSTPTSYADEIVSTTDARVLDTVSAVIGDEIVLSGISVDGTSLGDVVVTIGESEIASDGSYAIEIDNGSSVEFGLSGLIYNENAQVLNRPITYQDAIDALRMSVGLETVKAEAEGRSTSELEYIASDMTGDGYLNYVDAIQMLMASVGLGLDTPEGPSFKMIDSAFSDATIDEKNIYSPHITSLHNVVDDTNLNLNILLTGDITGI
jgi:hypothetical protein